MTPSIQQIWGTLFLATVKCDQILDPVEKAYATTQGRIYYSEGWWAQNLVGISYH